MTRLSYSPSHPTWIKSRVTTYPPKVNLRAGSMLTRPVVDTAEVAMNNASSALTLTC
ncbi:hypothetical protein [Pseudooctadecabacter sp.]|uniref:hypothetical protein n=1 Tax=Pseudooctadecabacter sp. TaxID=1966338 RepID=UPI0035C86AAF